MFTVVEPGHPAGLVIVAVQPCARESAVHPPCAQRGTVNAAEHKRLIAVCQLIARIDSERIRYPVLPDNFTEFVIVAHVPHAPHCRTVFRKPRAHGFRQRGKGYVKRTFTPIRFRDNDVQIACVISGIKIVNRKRTGRDRGFIERVVALANGHFGVGSRNPTHHWRVAALRFRTHSGIGGELHAAKADPGKKSAVGVAFANHHFTAQRHNRSLDIAPRCCPMAAQIAVIVERRLLTIAPQSQI